MDWYSFLVIHGKVIAAVEKICLEDKEKENEEAEMKKEKKKVRVWDLNRSIAAEAQAWENFINNQAGPIFYKSAIKF